jgi:hypothetical protein
LTVRKTLIYLCFSLETATIGKQMDDNLLAAITAAIQAYIGQEGKERDMRFGQRLNPWKMATRRELMSRRNLTVRGNPFRVRLRKYSLL